MTTRTILFIFFFGLIAPFHCHASTGTRLPADTTSNSSLSSARSMLMRLDTLNATDQSNFSRSEKRIVRKEVRNIKAGLRELKGARYMRTALIALIVIVPLSVFQMLE